MIFSLTGLGVITLELFSLGFTSSTGLELFSLGFIDSTGWGINFDILFFISLICSSVL